MVINIDKKLINKLVKKSFGILYSGNWNSGNHILGLPDNRGEKLNYIGRRKVFDDFFTYILPIFPIIYPSAKMVGKFLNDEGYELEIKREFIDKAKKYSTQYQKITGREVIIKNAKNEEYL